MSEVQKHDTVKVVNAPDNPSMIGQCGSVIAVFDTQPEKTVKVYIKGSAILYLKPEDVEVLVV